jgi:hypothetical protein
MADHVVYVEAHAVPVEASAPAPAPAYHRASSAPTMPTTAGAQQQSVPVQSVVNEAGAREYLAFHKWPVGLQDTSIDQMRKIAFRFLICDDSGSMMASDGHKLMQAPNGSYKYVLLHCVLFRF